jgi:acetyl esterase/lipase
LIHGDQDWTVSNRNSIELTRRLRAVGGMVHYVSVPDTGHGTLLLNLVAPHRGDTSTVDEISDFIKSLDDKINP